LYSIVPLALLAEGKTTVLPVVNLGRDVSSPVMTILSRYPRISMEGISLVQEKNNHAFLTYCSESDRKEVLRGGVPSLSFEQITPFLVADVFLVNFISGRDLSLETMKLIRAHTGATIYMDIHSLCLGIDGEGRRFWRHIPRWQEWVAQADVVQVNRGEAQLLAGSHVWSEKELLSFGRAVMAAGPSLLLVTLGSEGSLMVTGSGENIHTQRFSPHPPPAIVDTTGCGDVFLAAFVAEHARSGDAQRASRFANQAAGMKCGLSGIEDLEALRELRRGS
jgi:sugar/nucleoside kinase (ribokinase family)